MDNHRPQSTFGVEIAIQTSKMFYQIPSSWSINKLKCLLCSEIPSLTFDDFQLSHKGHLLRGNHHINQVSAAGAGQTIAMEIARVKSEVTFKEYYSSVMGKFMKTSSYENQPILYGGFQKYQQLAFKKANIAGGEADDAQLARAMQEEDNPANQIHPLFRVLQFLGTYLMIVLVIQHGKVHQIAIIVGIIILFYLIETYRKITLRKIRQNNRRQETREQQPAQPAPVSENINQQYSPVKGLLYLYFFKSIEIAYTFCFTMFPNLDIQIYLNTNFDRIRRAREKINRLRPNTFPEQGLAQNIQ